MGKCAIVAIPEQNDYVWRISSEKVPHLTVLFLGEDVSNESLQRIAQFLPHVVSTSMHKFWLTVDKRGKLGDKEADVLFFEKNAWNLKMLETARSHLLMYPDVRNAYDSAEQFPVWTPHLTLGYPETPAKPDNREYPGIHGVAFDKIALWTGESDGPEFDLESQEGEAMAMTDSVDDVIEESVLKHYGVKGMRWGVRRSQSELAPGQTLVTQKKPGGPLKTAGGKSVPASDDAINAARGRQIARSSGTRALSNNELQAVVRRMQLEQQYSQLSAVKKSAGRKFAEAMLGDVVKAKSLTFVEEQAKEDPRVQPLADALKKNMNQGKKKKN